MNVTGPDFEAVPPYGGDVPAFVAAPLPAGPTRGTRWVGPALGAGALILAVGAFLLGHATAGRTGGTTTLASAPASSTAGVDANANLMSALGMAQPAAVAAPAACPPTRGGTAGTLKSISGSTLTVTNRDGADVTVRTSASTKVTKVTAGAISDVTNGATVAVRGTPGAQSTIAAAMVAILPADLPKPLTPPGGPAAKPGAPAGLAIGTVQSVSGSSFTVLRPDGSTVTVSTSSSTTFSKAVTVKVGDLTIGQPLAAAGTPNTDGSIDARFVVQSPTGAGKVFGLPGFGRFGHGGGDGGEKKLPPSGPTTTTP